MYCVELQNSYCISQIEMSVTKNAKLAFHPHKLGRHAASAYTVCLRLWVKHAAETSISGFCGRQVTRREAAASGKINFLSHKTSCPRADRDTANTNHLYNICTTSAQRVRRWSDIVQMLYKMFCACWGGAVPDNSSFRTAPQTSSCPNVKHLVRAAHSNISKWLLYSNINYRAYVADFICVIVFSIMSSYLDMFDMRVGGGGVLCHLWFV